MAMENKNPKTHLSPKDGQDSDRKGSDPPAAAEVSLSFLKSLGEASAVFVAFTYIGGWSYVASYYSTFGLNPLELDLPLPVVCTTAFFVLFDARWPLYVIVPLLLVGIVFAGRLKRLGRRAVALILVVLILVASLAGVLDGRLRATEDMLTDSSELPYVAFSSKLAKTDQPSCVDYQTYGSFDCKLLLHTKGTYYFFSPIPAPKETLTTVGSLNVYTLADADVTGVHILRGLDRNARSK